jgi:HEAT repeat protein
MQATSPSQRERLRDALEQAGIVELGHRGTRRFSPWRRALACEMLGKIGCPQSVPVLLARLQDRRPEVRIAAVQALGDIGSDEAVPALSAAFLERRVAPTNVVNAALRRIGAEAAPAFERGVVSDDPVVRVSSCFGLSGIAESHGGAVYRLAEVPASDFGPRVRAAAASALGIVGGGNAPPEILHATADEDVNVRRNAVRALGGFTTRPPARRSRSAPRTRTERSRSAPPKRSSCSPADRAPQRRRKHASTRHPRGRSSTRARLRR